MKTNSQLLRDVSQAVHNQLPANVGAFVMLFIPSEDGLHLKTVSGYGGISREVVEHALAQFAQGPDPKGATLHLVTEKSD